MNRSSLRAAAAAAILGASALLGGCANPERPVEELSRARTLIEQAERNGAQQFAGADLERARQQLRSAEQADEKKDAETARRMAVQAGLDAELASAKTRQGKAEQAAQELATGTETLRQEAERNTDRQEEELTRPQ